MLLVDVRSQPYSQHFPDYNKDNLERLLKREGLHYRNYAREFGARQEDRRYFNRDGFLDFERFAQSPPFLSGFQKLTESMKQGYRFALMCAEKDPLNCHRAILVARAFHDAGYKVLHLLANDTEMTQEEMERRLLDQTFPNRNQMTLFDDAWSEEELLAQAYRKKNGEIGYHHNGESG